MAHSRGRTWIAIMAALVWLPGATAAEAAPATAPIGLFVTQLGDFNMQAKTFSASFWVWSLVLDGEPSALDSMEFPNAVVVNVTNTVSTATPRGRWVQKKVTGTFRQAWDLRNFPFDRQRLRIDIEESDRDEGKLIYTADARNSSIDEDLRVAGWTVTGTHLSAVSKRYRSTFGDPTLAPGAASAYTRAEFTVDVARSDHSGFWKLTAPAIAAACLALFSFFLHVNQTASLSPRFSMLAGAVFATVVSMRSASGELGNVSGLTLIDEAHLAVLFYIFLSTLAGVFAWWHIQRFSDTRAAARIDHWTGAACTLMLVALVGGLVFRAVR